MSNGTANIWFYLMWRTEYGDRVLVGAEAKVFAEALSSLFDEAIMDTLDDYAILN